MNDHSRFLTSCSSCKGTTSKTYAKKNGGRCKQCVTGEPPKPRYAKLTREQRIIEHGYQAYATEEGHYDDGSDR